MTRSGGAEPLWARDGRTLYYRWESDIFGVSFDAGRGSLGSAVKMVSGYHRVNAFRSFDIAPDGRFIVTKQASSVDTSLNIVLNWDRQLARLAPP